MCASAGDSETTAAKPSASGLSLENRRSFLGALLGVGAVFVGALLSVPLIRFALFPLLRRTTELKSSSVGELREFSSLAEPVMRTIRIEQVDGWRRAISEKAVYVTKDSQGQFRVLTSVCPHLGCTVPWNKEREQFVFEASMWTSTIRELRNNWQSKKPKKRNTHADHLNRGFLPLRLLRPMWR